MSEDRFAVVVEKAFALLQERKEVPLTEIEEMAEKEAIRGSAVIDELAITEGVTIDYARGLVKYRG